MLSDDDHASLIQQMGRRPRAVVGVAARCPAGHPAVITCYPLQRQRGRLVPFPTLYWLTCPALREQVSHLERDGLIAHLETELADHPDQLAALNHDHDRYQAKRWDALTPEDRQAIADPALLTRLRGRGIGGMTSRTAIKCLHLHLAHHLADRNVIGAMLIERFGVRTCP